MIRSHNSPRFVRLLPGFILALMALLGVLPLLGHAQDSVRETTSLKFVPADVSFYASMSRMREQVERVVKSKAAARFGKMMIEASGEEALEEGLDEIFQEFDFDNPLEQIKEVIKQEQFRQMAELGLDMVSNEIFVYGGPEYAEMSEIYTRFVSEMYKEMAKAAKENAGDLDTFDDEAAQEIFKRIMPIDKLEKLNMPDTVIGLQAEESGEGARAAGHAERDAASAVGRPGRARQED